MGKERRRKCSSCGKRKFSVLGRQKLCEECEGDMSYCTVCDEFADRAWGGGCRHVIWSSELACDAGCGSNDVEAEAHRASFVTLLKHLQPLKLYDGKPLLRRMWALLRANRFWTQWQGPLIGSPPNLALRCLQGDYCPCFFDISASTQESWGSRAIEEMQLGMAWLTSLNEKSKKANALTAQWIAEFMRAQP